MSRWCLVLVVLMMGCSGGAPTDGGAVVPPEPQGTQEIRVPSIAGITPPFAVEDTLAALGPSVGKSEDEEALKVEWEDVDWAGQTWNAGANFSTAEGDDSAVLFLSTKVDKSGITEQAKELCRPVLEAGGVAVLTWPETPRERYARSWRKQVESGDVGLGCLFQADEVFTFGVASGDMLLVFTGHSNEAKDLLGDSFLAESDWTTLEHIGDRIQAGETAYVVASVMPVQRGWRARDSASQLLKVDYTIENAGKASAAAVEHSLVLKDALGRTFTPSKEATQEALRRAGLQAVSELHPGVPKRQLAVFELPASEKRLSLVLPSVLGPAPQGEATLDLDFTERESEE